MRTYQIGVICDACEVTTAEVVVTVRDEGVRGPRDLFKAIEEALARRNWGTGAGGVDICPACMTSGGEEAKR